MLKKVTELAAMYESRWTLHALELVDSELHAALTEQVDMFHEQLVTGEDEEIIDHGEAMCRGWRAAIVAMEQSNIADDAYLVGRFGDITIAVGRSAKSSQRVRDVHGENVVWLTPREVAGMFFRIREVEAVKALWPDAEIVNVRLKESDNA